MDNTKQPDTQTSQQTAPQTPTSPVTQSVNGVTTPKKRGQISVNKAFMIIYAVLILAIFVGPLLVAGNDSSLLSLGILVSFGIPLLIVLVLIHIFLLWRDKKKNI